MSNENEINATVTTTSIMHKAMPSDGGVVHGITVQGDMRDLVNIGKVDAKRALNARTTERTALLTKAKTEYRKAFEARDAAIRVIPIPEDVFRDAATVANGLKLFYPGATVQRLSSANGGVPRDYVDTVDLVNKTMTAKVVVVESGVRTIVNLTRTYPLTADVVRLHEAVTKAEALVAGYAGDLSRIKQELANLDARVEELDADIRRDGLVNAPGGAAALNAMDATMSRWMATLDADMSTRALPAASDSGE